MSNTIEKPKPLPVKPENIPDELKSLKRWCVWKYELVNGRWTKIPYHPLNNWRASSNNPDTWATFKSCIDKYERSTKSGHIAGVGFFLDKEDDLVGCDIDHCCDDSLLTDNAQDWICNLNSYSELSPSGNGVRIWTRGNLPVKDRLLLDLLELLLDLLELLLERLELLLELLLERPLLLLERPLELLLDLEELDRLLLDLLELLELPVNWSTPIFLTISPHQHRK